MMKNQQSKFSWQSRMITIREAEQIVQKNKLQAGTEQIRVQEALLRVAADIVAAIEYIPRFTNSAMDGFAVRCSDINDTRGSVSLSIVGESRAGGIYEGNLTSGQTVRISTGAMLPPDADTVIPLEDVEELEGRIVVKAKTRKNQFVRFSGKVVQPGMVVMDRGEQIKPAHIGILASLGIDTVTVYSKPKVAIITTGSELVDKGELVHSWQIRDSNRPMLIAAATHSGAVVTFDTQVNDQVDEISSALHNALEKAEIILLAGGVSVGEYDLVRQAADNQGIQKLFWRVRQKPGKPLYFARKGDRLIFGLPGNPVSALMCYSYYVHPLLYEMQGRPFKRESVKGRLGSDVSNPENRTLFLRVRIVDTEQGLPEIVPMEHQDSHVLTTMEYADGFAVLKAGEKRTMGSMVETFKFPW